MTRPGDGPPVTIPLFLGYEHLDPPAPAEPAWPTPQDANRYDGSAAGFAAPLPGFSTNLFVQGFTEAAADLAHLADHTGVGAVLTFNRKGRSRRSGLARARDAVAAARAVQPEMDLLLDWNGYSGGNLAHPGLHGTTKRKHAGDGLSRRWVEDQHRVLGLRWALTDSGYCATLADVAAILADAAVFPGEVVVLLPVPHELLSDNADDLVTLLDRQPHPVAVVLEHEQDPFNEPGLVEAAVHLVHRADRPVLFLRSDTSALGLIAHGATAGAVGTTSGLRHLYPAADPAPISPQLAFVVPELLSYISNPRFLAAYAVDSGQAAWRCPCWFCNRRDLAWINAEPTSEAQEQAAYRHSVAAIADLGRRLATTASATGPVPAWQQLCGAAQAEFLAIRAEQGRDWEPKEALSHWRLAPTPV